MDSDWDLSIEQWRLMSRCTKCGHQLYPYSSRSAYAWAESAYLMCRSGSNNPEALRDQQSPGLIDALARRKPRFSF